MNGSQPRYTLRISRELLEKISYIAQFEGRSVNKQLEQLVKRCFGEFEAEHGEIKFDK